jgi:hypothetical protein
MIGNMGSAIGSDAVAGGVAGAGAGGIVSRPRVFERLGAVRVTVVSAPPGSGKTVLLRSWISWAGLTERVAWVPAGRGERDPQQFWLPVLAALRQTAAGAALVRELTATQLTRLGIPGPQAEARADHAGWHQIARLVQRGCAPALAVRILRRPAGYCGPVRG